MKKSSPYIVVAALAAFALAGCDQPVVETPTDIPADDALAECLVTLYGFEKISQAQAADPTKVDQDEYTNAYLEVANYCDGISEKTKELAVTAEQSVCLDEIDRMADLFRQLHGIRSGTGTSTETATELADKMFPEVHCKNLTVLDPLVKVSN